MHNHKELYLTMENPKTSFYNFLMQQRREGQTHFSVGINIPGNKNLEEITNNMEDIDNKLKRYLTAYNSDLKLKTKDDIYIAKVSAFTRTPEDIIQSTEIVTPQV